MNNTPSTVTVPTVPNSPAATQINEAIKNVATMNNKVGGKRKTRNRKTKRKQTRKNRKARKGTRRH